MVSSNAEAAECLVFTFKEGLLSKVAHDLRLRVTRLTVSIEPEVPSVSATFDLRSLRVETAMKAGREAPRALSSGDKQKIEGIIVKDVLRAARFPEARFQSREVRPTANGFAVVGDLSLRGKTREIRAECRRDGDRLVTEVWLNQPDFGIKPYSAMLGTLKVQPRVRVRLSVPAAGTESE